jgi:UDPglucose 6-dehydrogenase
VLLDERINSSHTQVPGPDGKGGFGGTCFPKDMSSLSFQMMEEGMLSYLIASAISRNKNVDRTEQDWKKDKGRAVS